MGVTNYRRIYGIDFSGAKDAGKRIWIASGIVEQDGLLVEECYSARPKDGVERSGMYAALGMAYPRLSLKVSGEAVACSDAYTSLSSFSR